MKPKKKLCYPIKSIREVEARAMNSGISANELMQRAGHAAFSLLPHLWQKCKRIFVFTGGGNNGGDGFEVARLAHVAGFEVTVFMIADPSHLQGAALQAYEASSNAGVKLEPYTDAIDFRLADLIVDAILGIGFHGELKKNIRAIFEKINQSGIPVFALDLPSGINADTGYVADIAIKADHTITFIASKPGLLTGDAANYVGQLHVADLGLPQEYFDESLPFAELLKWDLQKHFFKKRSKDSHKGDFGHVLVIGGDHGMAGAVCLAAEAALRTGAGLVSVVTRAEHVSIVTSARPEIMVHVFEEDLSTLNPLLEKADVILLGPGLGLSQWGKQLFDHCIERDQPMIIDADALTLLSTRVLKKTNRILTPHPGEAARLLTTSAEKIQENRFNAAHHLHENYEATIVLKGAGTVVCDSKSNLSICTEGNPGMATAGMGDVLAGIIAGLVAQDFSCDRAAKLGVSVHARAGDLAALNGERGLIASDLFLYLHQVVNVI